MKLTPRILKEMGFEKKTYERGYHHYESKILGVYLKKYIGKDDLCSGTSRIKTLKDLGMLIKRQSEERGYRKRCRELGQLIRTVKGFIDNNEQKESAY